MDRDLSDDPLPGQLWAEPCQPGAYGTQSPSGRLQVLRQRLADARRRLKGLRGFVAPELFHAVGREGAGALRPVDRNIVVVFVDLRGFTRFAEQHPLGRVAAVLDQYFGAMGKAIKAHGGTLERYTGDGVMVFFDDQAPASDARERALSMALQMQEAMGALASRWRGQAIELSLGVGIARGLARVGPIGCGWRRDYGAIGPVVNLAQRLCDRAAPGEVLVERSAMARLAQPAVARDFKGLRLHGLSRSVAGVRLLAPPEPATPGRLRLGVAELGLVVMGAQRAQSAATQLLGRLT